MKKKNSIFHFIRVYFSFSGLISYQKKKTHYEHISIERIWRIKIEGDKKNDITKRIIEEVRTKKVNLMCFVENMKKCRLIKWHQNEYKLCFAYVFIIKYDDDKKNRFTILGDEIHNIHFG